MKQRMKNRKPRTYRLSTISISLLNRLADELKASRTALVEYSILRLNEMDKEKLRRIRNGN